MNTGHDLAMALRSAYWAMHREADAALEPHGVTANQFVVLSILAEHGPLTQREIVDHASSDPNTIRVLLVALEDKGLVTRRPHAGDGRAKLVSLTAKGRRLHGELWTKSESFRERLCATLRPSEIGRLIDSLERLAIGIQSRETAPIAQSRHQIGNHRRGRQSS
jgi:DNA-binding MarR family transcriptional regulator